MLGVGQQTPAVFVRMRDIFRTGLLYNDVSPALWTGKYSLFIWYKNRFKEKQVTRDK